MRPWVLTSDLTLQFLECHQAVWGRKWDGRAPRIQKDEDREGKGERRKGKRIEKEREEDTDLGG